ncbi:MAG TPA: hypothetical protein VK509_19140, partial [Polyangiales bacterium]|nr:hypothetical protein [Polyangiales bacterium]
MGRNDEWTLATRASRRAWLLASALSALGAAACGGSGGGDDDATGQTGASGSSALNGGSNAFGNPNPDASTNHTMPRDSGILPNVGGCGHLQVRNLDLLFLVDNSGSMKEEQEALRREFPKMIRVLTTGDRNAD